MQLTVSHLMITNPRLFLSEIKKAIRRMNSRILFLNLVVMVNGPIYILSKIKYKDAIKQVQLCCLVFKERSSFYDSVLSFRPTVRPWENNANSSKTNIDTTSYVTCHKCHTCRLSHVKCHM